MNKTTFKKFYITIIKLNCVMLILIQWDRIISSNRINNSSINDLEDTRPKQTMRTIKDFIEEETHISFYRSVLMVLIVHEDSVIAWCPSVVQLFLLISLDYTWLVLINLDNSGCHFTNIVIKYKRQPFK